MPALVMVIVSMAPLRKREMVDSSRVGGAVLSGDSLWSPDKWKSADSL